MDDDSDDFVTELQDSKRKKLSLKSVKRPKLSSNCFNVTVSKDELAQSNTGRSTEWAIQTFQNWASQRNKRCKDQCSEDKGVSSKSDMQCKFIT